jgi:hypothetical protein
MIRSTLISERPAKIRLAAFVITATLVALAAGARADDIKVYRIAKDSEPATTATTITTDSNAPAPESTDAPLPAGHPDISGMPTMPVLPGMAAPAGAALTYATPAGWAEQTPSQMRVASFKIAGEGGKKADVSVVPLPGMAGGDEANVNRWRAQVGMPPAQTDELQKSAQSVDIGDQTGALYDIASESDDVISPMRIMAAILHREDMVWFFKVTGDNQLVEGQKTNFIQFLKSVKFPDASDATAQAQAPQPTQLPPDHPPIGGMGMDTPASGPISHEGQPNWQVPQGWQEVSGGQFLVAKFILTADDGTKAAVNVSQSAGTGGGVPMNVNRWRGQLGLPPQSEDEATQSLGSVDAGGGKAWLADMSGTDARTGQPARLVAVIVPQPDQTWFYKLMGDAKVVESHKDEFIKFVQGVKY